MTFTNTPFQQRLKKTGIALVAAGFAALSGGTAHASQAAGVLTEIFGTDRFRAKAEILFTDADKRESKFPVALTWVEGQLRADIDLTSASTDLLPGSSRIYQRGLRRAGLEELVGIFRPEDHLFSIILPGLKAYSDLVLGPNPLLDSVHLEVQREEVGPQKVNGKEAVLHNYQITCDAGDSHQIRVWKSAEWNGFPLKVELAFNLNQITLDFTEIQPFAKADFQTPSGYKKHLDFRSLSQAALARMVGF